MKTVRHCDKQDLNLKVGIAGAGAIAFGYAGMLLDKGHSVSIWSPSGSRTAPFGDRTALTLTGAIEGQFYPSVSNGPEDLVKSDVIILALPAYGYRFVLERLAPFLEARHTVVISGHLSFAALYLSKLLAKYELRIPIAVWNTTALTCKAKSDTQYHVGSLRPRVDMAAVPVSLAASAQATCRKLFGDVFELKDDILTIALSNLNPQSHMGIALCNLTRIERGETWEQNTNITPSVRRLIDALDRERVSIAKAFGKVVRTVAENRQPVQATAGRPANKVLSSGPLGPRDINTRYVFEDVPYGLVPTLHLAKLAGLAAPLHQSGVEILSACYERNFSIANDVLEAISDLELDRLIHVAQNGFVAEGPNI